MQCWNTFKIHSCQLKLNTKIFISWWQVWITLNRTTILFCSAARLFLVKVKQLHKKLAKHRFLIPPIDTHMWAPSIHPSFKLAIATWPPPPFPVLTRPELLVTQEANIHDLHHGNWGLVPIIHCSLWILFAKFRNGRVPNDGYCDTFLPRFWPSLGYRLFDAFNHRVRIDINVYSLERKKNITRVSLMLKKPIKWKGNDKWSKLKKKKRKTSTYPE